MILKGQLIFFSRYPKVVARKKGQLAIATHGYAFPFHSNWACIYVCMYACIISFNDTPKNISTKFLK